MYVVTDFDLEKYHFKSIYDNYDDGAENYVLEEPSVLIQTLIHPKEIFARYDGNEFAILLKNTNAEFAHIIAEKIQILLKVIHLFTKETITKDGLTEEGYQDYLKIGIWVQNTAEQFAKSALTHNCMIGS
ncbi:19840_t:CDS:2, partial [Gigaspora margarita]